MPIHSIIKTHLKGGGLIFKSTSQPTLKRYGSIGTDHKISIPFQKFITNGCIVCKTKCMGSCVCNDRLKHCIGTDTHIVEFIHPLLATLGCGEWGTNVPLDLIFISQRQA